MTSKPVGLGTAIGATERFPDFPPRDDMQNMLYLHDQGYIGVLRRHYGNSDTTLVMGEVPVAPTVTYGAGVRIPDLTIAFNVDRQAILHVRNGYAISLVGKPPDFVLEVASKNTGFRDYTQKRDDYERYLVAEYWRFDPSGGRYHDAALAGDHLVAGRYQPILVEWTDDSHCRGYSEALALYLCWEHGQLRWYDPATGLYLLTDDEVAAAKEVEFERASQEAERADRASQRASQETERADREATARQQAEEEVLRLRRRLLELGDLEG